MHIAAEGTSRHERRAQAAPIITRLTTAVAMHWAPLLVAVLGLVAALYQLGGKGLWGDEVWESMWAQQQSLTQTFARFTAPPDFPLSFALVHLSTMLGQDPFWVRLPSALLGAATVLVLYAVARDLFGRTTGLVAAVLLAVAPYHVWYAQDARPYAALACYALLSLYTFVRVLRRPTLLNASLFALATALDVYNHLFGLFPLAAELIVVAVWGLASGMRATSSPVRRDVARRAGLVVAAAAVAGVACWPLIPGIVDYSLNRGPGAVQAPPFQLTPAFLADLFGSYGGGSGWPLWTLTILSAIGVGGVVYRRNWLALALVAWLALPLGVLWLVQPHHIFSARYFLFMQPVYLLLAAIGLVCCARALVRASSLAVTSLRRGDAPGTRMAQSALAGVGSLVLVAGLLPPTWLSYRTERVNDWSAICSYLRRNVQDSDVVTGNDYIQGLMYWCFTGMPTAVTIDTPGSYSAADLAKSGSDVWYVLVGADTPDAPVVQRTYSAIPRRAWAEPGLTPANGYDGRLTFPQAEYPAAIYVHRATHLPSGIVFHNTSGRPMGWPDYVQLNPSGGEAFVRLALPARRPRVVTMRFFALAGQAVQVIANHRVIATITGTGSFITVSRIVPRSVGDVIVLGFRNLGGASAAVASAQLHYAQGRDRRHGS